MRDSYRSALAPSEELKILSLFEYLLAFTTYTFQLLYPDTYTTDQLTLVLKMVKDQALLKKANDVQESAQGGRGKKMLALALDKFGGNPYDRIYKKYEALHNNFVDLSTIQTIQSSKTDKEIVQQMSKITLCTLDNRKANFADKKQCVNPEVLQSIKEKLEAKTPPAKMNIVSKAYDNITQLLK